MELEDGTDCINRTFLLPLSYVLLRYRHATLSLPVV